MHSSGERVGFAGLMETGHGGEAGSILNDSGAIAGIVGKGEEGLSLVVAIVLAFSEPDRGSVEWLVVFVEDGDEFTLRDGFFKNAERAFANDGAAALSAADEFDDPEAAAVFDGGDFEFALDAELWGVFVFVGFHHVGDETIEIDVGADFVAEIAVVVKRVDFENFDDEFGDVLKVNGEGDGVVELVNLLGGGIEFDIDAVFEGLEFGRRKKGGPVAGLTDAVGDFCFGEDTAKPGVGRGRNFWSWGRL